MQTQPHPKGFPLHFARAMLQALFVLVKTLEAASSEVIKTKVALRAQQQELTQLLMCGMVGRHDESTSQIRQHIQKLQGFTEEMPKAIREILVPCIGEQALLQLCSKMAVYS